MISDKIVKSSRRDAPRLKTSIVPSYSIAHQDFAVMLLEWMASLFEQCSGFRALFAEIAFSVRAFKRKVTTESS